MAFRVIARLDVKPPHLVKGIHLEGVRKLGKPQDFADTYYQDGIDEIFYQDVVASLYGRNNIADILQQTAQRIFVPITVGGGIRSIDDIQTMLRSGADKVSLNTIAIKNPEIVRTASRIYGVQCIVVALEIIPNGPGLWEPLIDSGRQHTKLDAQEWAKQVVELGAGELLITSIQEEGTRKGFNFSFAEKLNGKINVPIILHGGAGSAEDVVEVAKRGYSGAVISSILHYKVTTINEIKDKLLKANIEVRI
ncbi:imidazole glycerol phosphate synthase, cyclase subunit HisF [Candidatus Magnetobacterium bavaricum]|uniref:imidazole glycerol-phosphate synthase n=1 Tax=Candidatus Magnetobacterium bavaricum TaxID=29290 RepID=A0A0F3GHC5_9BACT|nr:imidazole glycerol phosphate synthase, cyclase subunit HisF [Candidatus Magnetobacterium bavaricum]